MYTVHAVLESQSLWLYIQSQSTADEYMHFYNCILFVFCYRLHRLLADDGADDNKPSFHQLITASSDGILEHGQQVSL